MGGTIRARWAASHRTVPGAFRLSALAGGVAVAGAALWLGPVHQLPAGPVPVRLPWPLFALGFGATTTFAARLDVRRPAHSFALSELPLVLGLYLLSPGELLVARLAGSLAALALHRRRDVPRMAFDLAVFLLETCLALTVFAALGGGNPLGPRSWAAALLATLAAALLTALAGAAASSLEAGRSQWRMLLDAAGAGAVGTVANTSLALVAVLALSADLLAAVPLAVVAGVLLLAYRGYGSLRQRHRRLERLYGFTRAVSRATEVDATVRILLEQARWTLRAELAELLLREPGAGGGRLVRLAADGRMEVTGTTGGGPLLEVPGGAGAVHAGPIRDERIRQEATRRGLRDAVVAVLPGAGGPLGTLLVGNRLGEAGSFDAEDGRLLETMANQAAVALEKARVLDRLRMEAAERTLQALHDPLTGLGNRLRFLEELAEAIADRPPGGLTVLLLDLDRFKEINDTLGREAGDLLLLEVADRLVATAAGAELVARIGGDEFAILAGGSGLWVVAEGVEDEATRVRLAELGCQVVQGFLVGRAMPADRLLQAGLGSLTRGTIPPMQTP
jgi:GGDEF domain-containing protein